MPQAQTQDPRQAIAEANVDAILNGAERLLERRRPANISVVAAEAGVSRVTVYSHFRDRQRLLEAVLERTMRRAMAALESAEPERGPAVDALARVLAASWEEIGRSEGLGHASTAELSAEAIRRAHEPAQAVIRALVERGRRDGAFRTDVDASWLVTSLVALIHAAAAEARAGRLDPNTAVEALATTVIDLFVGRST
jgi:TetR/AcrR family transcriptional repressor of mexCD-oprJ operon